MNDKIIFFTSINNNYLSRALVLGESIKAVYGEHAYFVVFLTERTIKLKTHQKSMIDKYIDEVILANSLSIPNFENWIFLHNVVEACTAIKGSALSFLAKKYRNHKIFYIDPDIELFSKLTEAENLLIDRKIVLTPHLTKIKPGDISTHELSIMKHGVYNLGFLGVFSDNSVDNFISWWENWLIEYCFIDYPNGIFTDQKVMDQAPIYFDNIVSISHPGYNVATWNLWYRHLTIHNEFLYAVNDQALRFFHHSGSNSTARMEQITNYKSSNPLAIQIAESYNEKLKDCDSLLAMNSDWSYGYFEDGSQISDDTRKKYRHNENRSVLSPFKDRYLSYLNSGLEDKYNFANSPMFYRAIILGNHFNRVANKYLPKKRELNRSLNERIRAELAENSNEKSKFIENENNFSFFVKCLNPDVPTICLFVHNLGGGVDKSVIELTDLLKHKFNCIWLYPINIQKKKNDFQLKLDLLGNTYTLNFKSDELKQLNNFFNIIELQAVHIHHTLYLENVIEFLIAHNFFSDKKLIITLHDFYFISKNWIFLNENNERKEIPESLQESLISTDEIPEEDKDNEVVRIENSSRLLQISQYIIAPSEFIKSKYLPFIEDDSKMKVIPHPAILPQANFSKIHTLNQVKVGMDFWVGIFGDIGKHKGEEILEQFLSVPISERPNILALGRLNKRLAANVDLYYGTYDDSRLLSTLTEFNLDVIWLPFQTFESFSYTTTHALATFKPIVSTKIGAIVERLSSCPYAILLEPDSSIRDWISALKHASELTYEDSWQDFYVETREKLIASKEWYESEYFDFLKE